MKSVCAFFITCLTLCYSCNSKHSDIQSKEAICKEQVETYRSVVDFILQSKIEEVKMEGIHLNDTLSFLMNGTDSVILKSLINGKKSEILFFVFSSASCNSCVQIALEEVKKRFLNVQHNQKKIYIISGFTARDIIIFKEMHKWDYNKISLLKGQSSFVRKFGKFPTFFTINSNNEINKVFVHDKIYTQTTTKYLKLISE